MCQSELTEFFAELTEFAPELSEAQWVLFSETVLSKQYSARFLKFANLTFFGLVSGTTAEYRRQAGNGSARTVSITELSEFLHPHRVLGRELSEFLSAYY